MAQYVTVYLGYKGDYIPVNEISVSFPLGEELSHLVGYGKRKPIYEADIDAILVKLENRIKRYKEAITSREKDIEAVGRWTNSIADKIDIIEEFKNDIDDLEDAIDEMEVARGELIFISSMILIDDIIVYIGYEFEDENLT